MSDQKQTVIFVLDRSGSMENKLESTLESFNGYLDKLRDTDGLEFTLIQFDTISTDVIHRRKPIKDVSALTREIYKPRAGTPLIDAACIAIESAKQDYKPTDKVIITIMTDGLENASREFKIDDLHDKIKEASAWGWQFIFLGASIDNYATGRQIGIGAISTMSYDADDRVATQSAYAATADVSRAFFASGREVNFTEEAKAAAGDKYAKNYAEEGKEIDKKKKKQGIVDRIKI